MTKSTKPCLVINLLISIIILIITVVCSTIVLMSCEDDCYKFIYAIVPMCLLSISLLGFTVWCIFYVKKDDKKRMTISPPISAYPDYMFSNQQRGSSSQYHPPTYNGPYKSANSSRSSQSGYEHYRQRSEFEKRLLLEPRYVTDENGNYVSQSNIYASQVRLANHRSTSHGRLSRATSIRTNDNRQCPTCTSQILNTSTTSKLSPILSRSDDKRYDTTDSFTYHTVIKQ